MSRRRGLLLAVAAAVIAATALWAWRSGDDADPPPTDAATTTERTTEPPTEPPSGPVEAEDPDQPSTPPSTAGDGTTVPAVPEDIPGGATEPVPVDAPAEAADGVRVQLQLEPVEVEGNLPGERSGPGIAVTVDLANGTGSTIDLDGVTVDLIDADGASATQVVDPDREPLTGDLPPGERRAGTYVFHLPPERRTGVTITVKYAASAPMVVFEGDAPRG